MNTPSIAPDPVSVDRLELTAYSAPHVSPPLPPHSAYHTLQHPHTLPQTSQTSMLIRINLHFHLHDLTQTSPMVLGRVIRIDGTQAATIRIQVRQDTFKLNILMHIDLVAWRMTMTSRRHRCIPDHRSLIRGIQEVRDMGIGRGSFDQHLLTACSRTRFCTCTGHVRNDL